MDAAKKKSLSPAGLTALRLLLLLVVGLCLGQTRVWGFEAGLHHASGQITVASASTVEEIDPAWAYDVSEYAEAAESEGGLIPSLEGWVPNAVKFIENGGNVTYHADGAMTYTMADGTAVRYSSTGFPDFSPYLYNGGAGQSQVSIALAGSRTLGEITANAAARFNKTPLGYTWHHNEDVGLMELIEEEVHGSFPHTGGFSINQR